MAKEEENTSLLNNPIWWLVKENLHTPEGVSVPHTLAGSRKMDSEVSVNKQVNGEDKWRS